MVVSENVAKQQRHPNLREGGHAGAHDLHPSPCYALGKILPQNAQEHLSLTPSSVGHALA